MKYLFIRISAICAILFMPYTGLFGQAMHEVSIRAQAGIMSMRPSTDLTFTNRLGAAKAIDYSYFWHNKWGFTVGVEEALYRSSITGTLLGANTLIRDFTENQESRLLNIPVWAEHRSKALGKSGWRYYGKLGAKFGIPLKARYWEEGVGNGNAKLNLKTAISISTETGFRWCLTDHIALYTGVYIEYGLNDVRKDAYEASDFNHSIFNEKTRVKSLMPFSAGLMLRLTVAFFKSENQPQP